MRIVSVILLFISLACCMNAQSNECRSLGAQDVQMPAYAPIARAAHIEGIVRFKVDLSPDLRPEITLLEGSKFLEGSAKAFLEVRRYWWMTEGKHASCTYTASIEYHILQSASGEANNLYRVTTLGLSHTIVEIQPVKPTCMDCINETCPAQRVKEAQQPIYPPIAKAARVSGDVTA